MKIINPTGWEIEGSAAGVTYRFAPFSEKDVWIDEHAVILLRTLKHRGLNHIQFSESISKKYNDDFNKFRKDQAVEGLKNLKLWVRERWINERQAEMDIKHKAGAEADRALIDPSRFAGDEALVQSWIDALEKREAKPVEVPVKRVIVDETEKLLTATVKKRGRKPKSLGGLANNPSESAS